MDTGTILGGTVKLRNAVEAAVLAVGSAVPLFYLPLAFNIRRESYRCPQNSAGSGKHPALRVKFRPPPNKKSALKKRRSCISVQFYDTIIAESYCSKKDLCCADVVLIYCISVDKFSNAHLWRQRGYMD